MSDSRLEELFQMAFMRSMVNKDYYRFKRDYPILFKIILATLRVAYQKGKENENN